MSVGVVIYAEGAGEGADTSNHTNGDANPGDYLVEDIWGAAHILTRRALMYARKLHEHDIHFYEGLRADRRRARGADLLDPVRLRRLLAWNQQADLPVVEIMIVLFDEDGDAQRYNEIARHINNVPPSGIHRIVAAARQEFEAWLVGDPAALAACIPNAQLANPELLARGVAKERLASLITTHANTINHTTEQRRSYPREVRNSLAANSDLEQLRTSCPSFARFCNDLRAP